MFWPNSVLQYYFLGEFGDVYKGSLKVPGQKTTVVAIKTLKVGLFSLTQCLVIT